MAGKNHSIQKVSKKFDPELLNRPADPIKPSQLAQIEKIKQTNVWDRLHQKTPWNVSGGRRNGFNRSASASVARLLNQNQNYGSPKRKIKPHHSRGESVGSLFRGGMGCSPCLKQEVNVKRSKFGFTDVKGTQKYHNTKRDHYLKNGKLNIFDNEKSGYNEPVC